MNKQIVFNNLTYCFKSENLTLINCISFRGLLNTYENIKKMRICQQKNHNKIPIKSNLSVITTGNPKTKSKD